MQCQRFEIYCPARWIRPKLYSFDRSSLKGEARRILEKIRPSPPPARSLQSYRTVSYSNWQLGTELPMEHTTPTAPLVLDRTKIGKCAMKKFGINCQLPITNYRMSLISAGSISLDSTFKGSLASNYHIYCIILQRAEWNQAKRSTSLWHLWHLTTIHNTPSVSHIQARSLS